MKSEDGERVACSRAASGSGAEAGNLNCIFHLCFWTLFQAGFYFFVGFLLIIVISDVELIGHMTEKWKKITKSQKPSTCTSRSRNSVFYRNTFKDRLIGDSRTSSKIMKLNDEPTFRPVTEHRPHLASIFV